MKLIHRWQRIVTTIVAIALVAGISNILPPELNNVPKAHAAQVEINGDLYTTSSYYGTSPKIVFTSDSVGYAFYLDATNAGTVNYKKSTDGGDTWSGEVALSSNADANYRNFASVAVWYDRWTPNDFTGTKIYIVAQETYGSSNDDFLFKSLDTSDDSLSPTGTTWTKIIDGTSNYSGGSNYGPVTVTKSTEGNLFASTCVTSGLDVYISADSGASWATTTSGLDDVQDYNQLLPIGASGGGVILLNQDYSGNDLRASVYDEDGNSWSGLNIIINNTMIESVTNHYECEWGAAVNKSTGDVYLVGNNYPTNAAADIILAVFRYDGTTLTSTTSSSAGGALTDVYTNIGTAGLHGTVAIDQHNGDLYAFYIRGTIGSSVSIYYKKSTDQGASWGSESSAVSSSAGNYQGVTANCTSLYKIFISWNDATNATMSGVNYTDTSALDISDARMILLYDGASIPAGWSSISDSLGDIFYHKFPRGMSSYGAFGGSDTHDHVATMSSFSDADAKVTTASAGTAFSPLSHTHTYVTDSDTVSILPTYRELQIIQYDNGLPADYSATPIPANAIALFNTATMPSGWTQYSAQDNKFIRGGPDGEATGGASGAHGHTVSFLPSGGASGTPIGTAGAVPIPAATAAHSHTISSYASLNDGNFLPINTDVVLGQNGASDVATPGGMIAMFSAAPGGAWASKSGSGEDFYQRYLEAKTSYVASGGGATTHSHNATILSTNATATSSNITAPGASQIAGPIHKHSFTLSFDTLNNLPTYADVLIYQYPQYTPDSRNWRVYDAENVADPVNVTGTDNTIGDAIMDEETDTTPAGHSTRIIYIGNAVKLRMVVGETAGVAGVNVKYRLQYDTDSGFSSPTEVEAQGGTTANWRYYNGGDGVDDGETLTVRLSGSPSAGQHNEDASVGAGSGSTFDPSASSTYEHEFTIQLNPDVPAHPAGGTSYYFRLQYMENSDSAGGSWAVVAKNASNSYPVLTTATAELEVSRAPANVSLGTYASGGTGTLQYVFTTAEGITFWDKRGTATAYDITITKMTLDKNGGGDAIPGSDITWTSTVADPPDDTKALKGSFASDRTGVSTASPCTLNLDCNAYTASTTEGKGGLFFSPTIDLGNLNSRSLGTYTGIITITIV